eukprot:TRINITY_DN21435_c0_g1_i1.p1 TRINITY_DN21435_c0_g1~~TRINITY_DN21435_c0_g1_i1.p1  ORF type:complete len:279 (-),score=29.48 TRINITY_DN21435_c0_g1_i1:97-933(-)
MADVQPAADADTGGEPARSADKVVAVELIHPNPDQPRRTFNDDALAELAASIREKGVIQPLIVRKSPSEDGKLEIVAGERRWRASQLAELHEVPVIIREFDDTEVLEVAIIENIQRADLNPVDEAHGYQQLMARFGHTQDQLAKALGKSRSHIANMTRLLSLPAEVLDLLTTEKISAGHARTLVGRDDASALARQVAEKGLTVRDAEKLTRKPRQAPKSGPTSSSKDADTRQIELELAAHLGMKVSIDHKDGSEKGTVTLQYRSLQQLDDLLRHLSRD